MDIQRDVGVSLENSWFHSSHWAQHWCHKKILVLGIWNPPFLGLRISTHLLHHMNETENWKKNSGPATRKASIHFIQSPRVSQSPPKVAGARSSTSQRRGQPLWPSTDQLLTPGRTAAVHLEKRGALCACWEHPELMGGAKVPRARQHRSLTMEIRCAEMLPGWFYLQRTCNNVRWFGLENFGETQTTRPKPVPVPTSSRVVLDTGAVPSP